MRFPVSGYIRIRFQTAGVYAFMAQPLVIAGFFLIFGLGTAGVRHFEKAAADDIRSKLFGGPDPIAVSVKAKLNGVLGGAIGDLSQVEIKAAHFSTPGLPLYTEPDRSTKGKVKLLRLELSDFVLGNLRVERLQAEIPNCRYDYALALARGKIRLSRSGVGAGSVRLRDRDLESFILSKFHEIKRVHVTAMKGEVLVEGYGEFLVINTNFSVRAKLVSPNGYQLVLSEAQITFDGNPAEAQASRVLLETLNPVVDLRKDLGLLDAISVEKIVIAPGYLEASGKTRIPVKPSE